MMRTAVPVFERGRSERDTATSRFEAEHATAGCGDADRTSAVAAVCHGKNAAGDQRRGAARGAAGGPFEIPGVPRLAEENGLGRYRQPEFRRVRLAEDGKTCLFVARH